MLVPHMSNEVIISLDPIFVDILTSENRTVKPSSKVHRLIVSVECLLRFERGSPSTSECAASVGATRASVWTASAGLVDMKDKCIVERGTNRFPGHLDDPQKTLFPKGPKLGGIITGL